MRIDNNTAAYHSIIWFARDLAGRIIVANSMEGAIPDFAAEDKERTEGLAQRLCGIKAIDRNRTPALDYKALASMGFYCFANSDPYEGNKYDLQATPEKPRLASSLDEELQRLLAPNALPIDAETCNSFRV